MMIRRLFLFALLLALLQPFSASASNIDQVYTKQTRQTWGQHFQRLFQRSDFNKSYAVVIGVSQFNDFQNLATTNDPIRMKDYLLNEAGFDYVRLITGRQVNLNKIRSIMVDEMPRLLGPNDRFVFYWSGHGVTDKVNGREFGYLPVSYSKRGSFSNMLDMNDLSSWDNKLGAKQVLYLLDSCFSGLGGNWFQKKSDFRGQTLKQIARPSRQILTAGLADEETYVIDSLGGSVFTTALIDGLKGAADTEFGAFPKDGIISGRELELYIKRRVGSEMTKAGLHNRSLTPLLKQKQDGDFFFFSDETVAAAPASTQVTRAQVESGITTMSGNQKAQPQRQSIIRLLNNLNLIEIPPGQFQMGSDLYDFSDYTKPVHTVTISYPFLMSETEITFDQYDIYATAMGKPKPSDEGWGRGTRPVINVSWNDAQGYVKWLSQNNAQGLQCRLPSEAEWEYAARAGTSTAYPWGNEISHEFANYGYDGNEMRGLVKGRDKWMYTAPVGQFPANHFGLKDMHGNVWEWVQDCANKSYQGAPVNGSAWLSGDCRRHIWRGDSWLGPHDSYGSAERATVLGPLNAPNLVLGFRVACSSPTVH